MKIAFLLYPVQNVKVDEDSSFWIMHELLLRGHEVFYFESKDLFRNESHAAARLTPARLHIKKGYLPSPALQTPIKLTDLDCLFIRKEPPFDIEYLTALQILEGIKNKVFVLNDPQGIALSNEKLFSLEFSKYIPETLVTQDIAQAKAFVARLKKPVVIKPLHEKGGVGISSSGPKDRNLPSLLESATDFSRRKIVIQRFVSADRFGDKRIVVLDGRPLGAFLRKPSASDFRANLSKGGLMQRAKLTPWDKKLVEEMAPKLSSRGLYFAGLDVIGKYLTEVNVTSPAGIPEVNHFTGLKIQKEVADFIEKKV